MGKIHKHLTAFAVSLAAASGLACAHTSEPDAVQRVTLPALVVQHDRSVTRTTVPRYADSQAYAAYLKGRLAERGGDWETAAAFYRRATGLDPESVEPLLHLAGVLVRLENLEGAQVAAERALEIDESRTRGHMILAGIATSQNRYDDAVASYRRIIELNPGYEDAYVYLGSLQAQARDFDGAEQTLLELLERSPENIVAFYYLGHLHAERRNFKQAIVYYKQALAQQPRFQSALAELGVVLEMSGDVEGAIERYRELLRYYPERTDIRRRLSQLYLGRNDLPNALSQLQVLGNQDAKNVELRLTMGLIYFEQGNLERALEEFQFVAASEGAPARVHLYVGAAKIRSGDLTRAREAFSKVPAEAMEYTDAQIQLALLDRQDGRVEEAFSRLRALVETETAQAEAFDVLSSLYREERKYTEALDVLTEGIARFPKEETLLYGMGVTLDLKGEWEAGIEKMKALLEVNPDHAHALNYIGYTWVDRSMKLDEAEALISRAVELAPYDGYILDSLGWLYFQRGDYEQAREILHRAGELAEDAIIFEHIADAALKLGKHEEAEHFLKRALELEGTKPEDRERISEKYQELVER